MFHVGVGHPTVAMLGDPKETVLPTARIAEELSQAVIGTVNPAPVNVIEVTYEFEPGLFSENVRLEVPGLHYLLLFHRRVSLTRV